MTSPNLSLDSTLTKLADSDLLHVRGGMKWQPVDNPDVIDARGGSFRFLWWTFSIDGRGNLSIS